MKTINTTIEIDAPPQEVWSVLTDFPSHARWNPFFARVEGEPTVGATLTIKARKDDGSEGIGFAPTILEAEPGRVLRWKGQLLVKGIFDGEHIFALSELAGGRTKLDHSENFGGVLIPLMGKVLADTEDGFNNFNAALADEIDARREANCNS